MDGHYSWKDRAEDIRKNLCKITVNMYKIIELLLDISKSDKESFEKSNIKV